MQVFLISKLINSLLTALQIDYWHNLASRKPEPHTRISIPRQNLHQQKNRDQFFRRLILWVQFFPDFP